jgi:DNA-dependent RNA polymerase auxiliary subunit epsilon
MNGTDGRDSTVVHRDLLQRSPQAKKTDSIYLEIHVSLA